MRIFICWSGEFSRRMAEGVAALLEEAFPGREVEPAFSDQIKKGAYWVSELEQKLKDADAGIVCLTPENLHSPWIHFEAGALAWQLERQACNSVRVDDTPRPGSGETTPGHRLPIYPLLHEVEPAQITGPLAAYQATTTTERDVLALLQAIGVRAGLAPRDPAEQQAFRKAQHERFRKAQRGFAKALAKRLGVGEVIPAFVELFQRMTFDEPVHQCMSQRWLDRHRGVSETREQIASAEPLVRAMCEAHHCELLRQLEAALKSYEDALGSLLMKQDRYPLSTDGALEIEGGAREACESRRLKVKAIVGRLLDDPDLRPLTPEAVRYFGAETFKERKLIVHRLENRVRTYHERRRAAVASAASSPEPEPGSAPSTQNEGTMPERAKFEYRGSLWDLDRINYYLNEEYGSWASPSKPSEGTRVCAIRDVAIEMERALAAPGGVAMMPVGYALGALRTVLPADLEDKEADSVRRVLDDVARAIADATRDPGGRIKELVDEIRARLPLETPGAGAEAPRR